MQLLSMMQVSSFGKLAGSTVGGNLSVTATTGNIR